MTTFNVEADIGTVHATVEADSADEATNIAVQQWDAEAWEIFTAGTFTVRETEAA